MKYFLIEYQSLYLQRCKFNTRLANIYLHENYKWIKYLITRNRFLWCSVHHYKTEEDAHRPFDF